MGVFSLWLLIGQPQLHTKWFIYWQVTLCKVHCGWVRDYTGFMHCDTTGQFSLKYPIATKFDQKSPKPEYSVLHTLHTPSEKLGTLSTASQVELHLNLKVSRECSRNCIAGTPKWSFYQPSDRDFSRQVGKEVAELWMEIRLIARMLTCQPHLPQENWWKGLSPWRQAKPQDQMIFIQSSFFMQEMLQPSGCISIFLPLLKDVKSPKSGTRQL